MNRVDPESPEKIYQNEVDGAKLEVKWTAVKWNNIDQTLIRYIYDLLFGNVISDSVCQDKFSEHDHCLGIERDTRESKQISVFVYIFTT